MYDGCVDIFFCTNRGFLVRIQLRIFVKFLSFYYDVEVCIMLWRIYAV
jgi:hypothetical protein